MLLDSFEHAAADFDARLLIETRNEAETVINATEKSLRRPDFEAVASAELTPVEVERIHAALSDLKQAMTSTERDVIHEKTDALNHATRHLAEIVMNRSVREALAGKNVEDV
jgi:molecular chaperone DnaK/molecular chaperone HscA